MKLKESVCTTRRKNDTKNIIGTNPNHKKTLQAYIAKKHLIKIIRYVPKSKKFRAIIIILTDKTV